MFGAKFEGVRHMSREVRKQLPIATKWMLDSTAFDARQVVGAALPLTFTIRSTWIERGLHVLKAKKGDFPHTFAVLGNRRPFMDFHVAGGRDKKTGGKRGTIVPVRARKTKGAKLRLKTMPSAVFGRDISADMSAEEINKRAPAGGKWFARELPSGAVGVFQRRRKRDRHAELWWVLEREVEIPKRWRFQDQVDKVAAKRLGPNFARAMDRALRTAR